MSNKDTCVYCGSPSYGRGCPYSPNKIHVHIGDPKKCIYCGSVSRGIGCPYNPHDKTHIHGLDYNQMVKDCVEVGTITGYLIDRITKPIEETQAYKLGIINEQGKKIKEPETLEEKSAYTAADIYINNIKSMLGNKIDIINGALYLEKEAQTLKENQDSVKLYEHEIQTKEIISNTIKDLKTAVADAKEKGLSTSLIEKIILDCFLD